MGARLTTAPDNPPMIVSLGLMSEWWQIGILMAAVIFLIALGWAINRLVGVPYPIWRPIQH